MFCCDCRLTGANFRGERRLKFFGGQASTLKCHQPLPQHPRQGPRRQAIGRHRGLARRLSEAGGVEHVGRFRAPRAVGGSSLPDELTPAGQQRSADPATLSVELYVRFGGSTSDLVG